MLLGGSLARSRLELRRLGRHPRPRPRFRASAREAQRLGAGTASRARGGHVPRRAGGLGLLPRPDVGAAWSYLGSMLGLTTVPPSAALLRQHPLHAVRAGEPRPRGRRDVDLPPDVGLDAAPDAAAGDPVPGRLRPRARGDGEPGVQPFHLLHLLMATHERTVEGREAQAAREVGQTEVSRTVAALLAGAFAVAVGGLGAMELIRDVGGTGSPWADLGRAPARAGRAANDAGLVAGNRAMLEAMSGFEDRLEERSAVSERVLPAVQGFLTETLEAGNEQVVVGRRGWLYFRPAVDHLTGPPFLDPARLERRAEGGESWQPRPEPDPVRALADFHAQLAYRGVGLVVVVTPVKAALHPEGLAPALADASLPLENPSLAPFIARLQELEIPAFDPGDRLAAARAERGWPQFLRSDTHWTAQAVETTAEGLAAFLRRHARLPERSPVAFTRDHAWVEGRGDIAALLKLDDPDALFPPERVPVQPVRGPGGEPWRPDPEADVLVLGDSFTNVYSQAELGWGEGAGLAEQLAYFLQRPVDRIAVNAGGPSAARERMASALASGDDRLAGKRLVVYQVTARELSAGDWRLVNVLGDREVSVRRPEEPLPARGLVTWESNRSGAWRIWTRRLEGSPARQLSPDEPGRQHCCAHLSPDGSKLVYLSRDVPDATDKNPNIGNSAKANTVFKAMAMSA